MTRPEFAQQIASRRSTSPKHLLEPGPSADVLEAAAAAAFAAPSHFSDFPVRFVIIESRERLAHLFEAELPADADAEKHAKAAGKAKKGPMQNCGRDCGKSERHTTRTYGAIHDGGRSACEFPQRAP